MMEHTPVIIVGAGPSGLTLGLCLARFKVKSVILEKETEITQDPRGVYLSGDAVRVLWDLGIQEEFAHIGHEQEAFMFHKGSFINPSFYGMETITDWRHQAIPDGYMQIQPELEKALRSKIETSDYCELCPGCEVTSVEEVDQGMSVGYRNVAGDHVSLLGSWLVGADGKKGFVRKRYLEPVADVRQETGLYPYEGTWIAANLHIELPTPQSHPQLAVWELGMTPDEVYDLFWPDHLHFCSPPGKPTASMRFGPQKARLWRHEFAEPDWNDTKNAEELFWEHLLPMLTRDCDGRGNRFRESVTFPKDCIEVRRCRPYTFFQKVVNKWFYHRTLLIGDAAHVFPPFGGQGIAAGIRDADALAWRLALFTELPQLETPVLNDMLTAWSHERKQGVDDSARFTRANGLLANTEETWSHALWRNCMAALKHIPLLPQIPSDVERAEQEAYKPVDNGFFLSGNRGGGKVAQVYLKEKDEEPVLSDELLKHDESLLTLISLDNDSSHEDELNQLFSKIGLPSRIISAASTIHVSTGNTGDNTRGFRACSSADLSNKRLRKGYQAGVYAERLGNGTRFAILRPDRIVYAAVNNLGELEHCLQSLKLRLGV